MRTIAFAVALASAGLAFAAAARAQDDHSTGARVTPVHRFRLRNENDQPVRPSGLRSWPLSNRTTCGACHDYAKIAGGFHFNAATSDAPGRKGEPWVWVDELTGTQLPLSYRDRAGAWKPSDVGITPWRFTQQFGRHLPGGGVSEPAGDDAEFAPDARWGISGKLEVNCLGCHSTSKTYSHSEWAKQVGRENYRWAATAASGMGDVGGMASRAPDTWIPTTDLHPDANAYSATPAVRYAPGLFDHKQRTFMDLDKPQDKRCLYCHSVTETDKHKWQVSGDVHTAAGLACVSCHRNGEDHRIIRGYAGEGADKDNPAVAELSCQGCHYGVEGAEGAVAMGGRLGAPRPRHAGLPPLHLKKMTCTACHSGPVPGATPVRVWTSRANRLGIAGRAQWRTAAPAIVEPVFVRGPDGKIAPHRMMWPAFWGKLDGEKVTPLLPDDVAWAAKGVLDADKQIGAILGYLARGASEATQDDNALMLFVVAGKMYEQNIDGGLDEFGGAKDLPEGFACRFTREVKEKVNRKTVYRKVVYILSLAHEWTPAALRDDHTVMGGVLAMLRDLNDAKLGMGQAVLDAGNKIYSRQVTRMIEDVKDERTGKVTKKVIFPFMLREVTDLKRTPGKPRTPTFGWLKDGQVAPLLPDFLVKAFAETAGTEQSFTEAQAAMVLEKLADREAGDYVYVSSGKMFRLEGGKIVASDNPAAEAVSWPMAHDVRPAGQALGAGGCGDCHAWSSPILSADVVAVGPMKTENGSVKSMHELADVSLIYHRLFGLTFIFRTVLKFVLICMAGIIAAVLLAYGLRGVRGLAQCVGSKE